MANRISFHYANITREYHTSFRQDPVSHQADAIADTVWGMRPKQTGYGAMPAYVYPAEIQLKGGRTK